jgi:prepilin-type processing-associated H-X9-DG protein
MPAWAWVLIGCIPVALIGVIAIVAAILFPVFAQAREKARETSCMSNEKQLSLGLLQYVQDNDDQFPTASEWMDKTAAYVGADRIYHCPSVWGQDPTKYGYAFNSALGDEGLSAIADPRTTPELYDSTDLSRNATDAVTSLPSPARHLHDNNIAFADGHAESVSSTGM